jgi:hypothetical protein
MLPECGRKAVLKGVYNYNIVGFWESCSSVSKRSCLNGSIFSTNFRCADWLFVAGIDVPANLP